MPVYVVSVILTKRFSTDIRVEAATHEDAEGMAFGQAQAQFDNYKMSSEIEGFHTYMESAGPS